MNGLIPVGFGLIAVASSSPVTASSFTLNVGGLMQPLLDTALFVLVVTADFEKSQAAITWSYDLGTNTPHFGDCDQLPTGNLL